MRDQHPVSWLLDKLQPGVYEPLMQWLHSVDPDCMILPSCFVMPDCWKLKQTSCLPHLSKGWESMFMID